jgi:hypothetical protein
MITALTNRAMAAWASGVCPQAPPGMQQYQDQLVGWVKWGVIALMALGALVSLGGILVGRLFSQPHASRAGAMGLAVVVICAILFVTILGVINGIVGSGC